MCTWLQTRAKMQICVFLKKKTKNHKQEISINEWLINVKLHFLAYFLDHVWPKHWHPGTLCVIYTVKSRLFPSKLSKYGDTQVKYAKIVLRYNTWIKLHSAASFSWCLSGLTDKTLFQPPVMTKSDCVSEMLLLLSLCVLLFVQESPCEITMNLMCWNH